ncbi:MAG: cation transporter [Lachnospiraceae bacterium]|nr:cation transporter [Lachnospiraceae bacterium]
MDRNKKIIQTSIIGIIANVLLAGFKAFIGIVSHSVAITMDAVNNLSDALSSAITIVGTRIAGKAPDKKHPMGHGRVEYLSAMIIAVIILYAGVTALIESVKKIIHPETPDYSVAALVIIVVATVVKIVLGTYVKGVGKKVHSDSLVASGEDARLDAVITATTFVAAMIYIFCQVSLEAYLAAIISLVIIKAGFEMLQDTISHILGERVDSELTKGIKESIMEFPEVSGAYDLVLHNYGPNMFTGSVHIEVPCDMSMNDLDKLERQISEKIFMEYQVMITGIGIYCNSGQGTPAEKLLADIRQYVMNYEHVLQIHGFFFDEERKEIRFDLVIDFMEKDRNALHQEIQENLRSMYPDYAVYIALDNDISD